MTGVFIFWSDEHEETEEKTKREIEPSRLARHYGRSPRHVQTGAWGDQEEINSASFGVLFCLG